MPDRSPAPPRLALICPTMWDDAELPALVGRGCAEVRHFGYDASEDPGRFDALAFIREATEHFRADRVDGIMASDDYPGTPVAAVIARELGFPGPSPRAVLLCQHKYYSRIAQREVVPEAVPDFALVDPNALDASLAKLRFPVFVKPVKSFFSLLAQPVADGDELERLAHRAQAHLRDFVRPFNQLLARCTDFPLDGRYLIAERRLSGRQVTLEGCVFRGEVLTLGVVDSIMYPGGIAFRRFEYPSALPAEVQARMADVAARFMRSIDFGDGLFNIEMMYDPAADTIHIIEVNPRMCPQFADLMEKVNGVNTYEVLIDLAAGRRPTPRRGGARFAAAASLVPRLFEDAIATRVPGSEQIERLLRRFPDARLKILCREGQRLGAELQDGVSYRYAVLNIGGESREDVLRRGENALAELEFAFERVTA